MALRPELVEFTRKRASAELDPEDIVQDALAVVASKIHQLREPARARAWMYRILRRLIMERRSRVDGRVAVELAAASELDSATTSSELCGCSVALLDSLPPQYAEMLRRIDVDGEALGDVAATLGTTVNNVTVRLHRARKALRDRLRETCGTTSIRRCQDCGCGSSMPPGSGPASLREKSETGL